MANRPDRARLRHRLSVLALCAAFPVGAHLYAAADSAHAEGPPGSTASEKRSSKPAAMPGAAGIMKVDDVKPGMKGYAVTVFSGEKPDRFDIEVVDVIRDFQPGQDAIFFRSPDPRLQHSGIVGGMSGSPIFIDGKMVGALAYGYRFNKDPLGGITPIENMLEVDRLPFRPDVVDGTRARGRDGTAAWADQMLGLSNTAPVPPRRRPQELQMQGLQPLGAPMNLSGFSPRTAQYLADTVGLTPVQGGSGGGKAAWDGGEKHKWQPGDSVSVVLIGGDNSAAPNGTVTWVGGKGGDHLLAFGHPMYGIGPTNLPIADARVHTIINSVERSVKIASPRDIQGTMIQDRQPAIVLRDNQKPPLIPVTTTVKGPDDQLEPRSYQSVVAESRVLTPALAVSLLLQAVEEAAGDAVEVTAVLEQEIVLETSKGVRTIKASEESWFPQGVVPGPFARSRATVAMQAALDNQFELAKVVSVKQSARVEYGLPVQAIEEIRVRNDEVRPGDLLELSVKLRSPRGDVEWREVSVRIPDDVGDQEVQIEIAGGDWVAPYRPVAKDLDDLLDTIMARYPSRSLVASVYSPQEGLSTEYGLIEDLPGSVLETLSPDGASRQAIRFKRASRRVIDTKALIMGEQRLEIDVLPPKLSE